MTLKQKIFLKELPLNDYDVKKSAEKAKYAPSSAKSTIYTQLKKSKTLQEKIKELYTEEGIKTEQARALKDFKKSKDNTNRQRAIEFMGKISGIVIDKQEVTELDKPDAQFSLDRLSKLRQTSTN
ncbi:MAG TPA: hypothetical protein DHV62_08070 [Elusimicrobia bacterium]|nr:hypothetical protein [Elusimicrobiota bacterium]